MEWCYCSCRTVQINRDYWLNRAILLLCLRMTLSGPIRFNLSICSVIKAFCLCRLIGRRPPPDPLPLWGRKSSILSAGPLELRNRGVKYPETANSPVILFLPSPLCPWEKYGCLVMYEHLMISDVATKSTHFVALTAACSALWNYFLFLPPRFNCHSPERET